MMANPVRALADLEMIAFKATRDFLLNSDEMRPEIATACSIGITLALEDWLIANLGRRGAYEFLQGHADRIATEIITPTKGTKNGDTD